MSKQLTDGDISRVRELVGEGKSYKEVEDLTGFSPTTISRVARDVCQRSRGKPKRVAPALSDSARARIARTREALSRLPGKREVLNYLQMGEAEYNSLRYLCRVHGLEPLRSKTTGRPPTKRGVLREIEDRKAQGEDLDAILTSLSPRKRALI